MPSINYLERELYELVQSDTSIFEFIQKGSLDGLWYWDLENPDCEWMSRRFWETLGFNPDDKQHLSSEWQDLIFPEDLEKALENSAAHCKDPSHPYDQTVRYRGNDGSTIWVRCRGIAIRNSNGEAIRMLGAHSDITEQKRVEELLRKRTVELQSAVNSLREALDQIKTLEGLLSVCSYCRRIQDDDGNWKQLENFIQSKSDASFSHGICSDCAQEEFGLGLEDIERS